MVQKLTRVVALALSLFIVVQAGWLGTAQALSSQDALSLGGSSIWYWPAQTGACSTTAGAPGVSGTLPSIIPEPYNGAFTSGANKHNVAPALIAALFTEENFTKTPTDGLAARWQNLLKTHPDPNSGWPTNQFHTEGAFQFIPSTWAAFGEGGNPQNISDAANGAAKYVAHNGATTDKPPASWQNAIFAYNHAQWYVDAVMNYYNFYSTGTNSTAPPAQATAAQTSCATTTSNVSCNNGSSVAASSQLRTKIVCLAQNELSIWKAPGGPQGGPAQYCKKYIRGLGQPGGGAGGSCEEWCADFASWIYNQAGYPLRTNGNWDVPGVHDIMTIGQAGGRFAFKGSNYTPQPGDLVIHGPTGSSHVNIVVSVSGNIINMIGGDQGSPPYGGPDSKSDVSTDSSSVFFGGKDQIYGYVIPTSGSSVLL